MSMNILEILQEKGFSFCKVSSSEYAGECPFCGGNDRFIVWPEQGEFGRFWCRGCGKSGDSIEFLRLQGMSYPEACNVVGKELKPVNGGKMKSKFSIPKEKWTPISIEGPKDSWQEKAGAFVDTAHSYLLRNPNALAWLAEARGISLETVRTVRLGWNEKDTWIAREAWGLPTALKEDGTLKKLWLPGGLVIPTFAGNCVVRIRIRRLDGEPRYVVVSGSAMFPMMRGNEGPVVVVVESELDAVLIEQEMQGKIRAVALGSVTIRPDDTATAMISKAPIVLISLDADEAGEQNSWTFWKANFPQVRVWPVPVGKDPTDFFLAGGSIKAWIDAASYKPVSDELDLNEIEKECSRKNFVSDTKVDPTEDEILATMKTLN